MILHPGPEGCGGGGGGGGGGCGGGGKSGESRPPNIQLYIAGLPIGSTEESLKQFFVQYGEVYQSKVLPPKPGKTTIGGFVRMPEFEAKWCIENLDGFQPEGYPGPLTITYAKDREAEGGKGMKGPGKGFFSSGDGFGGKDGGFSKGDFGKGGSGSGGGGGWEWGEKGWEGKGKGKEGKTGKGKESFKGDSWGDWGWDPMSELWAMMAMKGAMMKGKGKRPGPY